MFRLENVRVFSYDEIIVEADNMKIESGKSALIIGNNKSGKTLLLESMKLKYKDYNGGIFLRNKEIHLTAPSDTIYIEHQSQLLNNRSCWENITMVLPRLKNRLKLKIEQFCQISKLDEVIDNKIEVLSISEKKMLEIVRAVSLSPYLIMIDDLDSYFDEESLFNVMTLLKHSLKAGSNIVATSRSRIEGFDYYYRIQDRKLKKL